ncbi:MAG TPA: glycine zipper domain-containing protein [Nitrospira sp.]|nr:glycine zipper domain-containing protein [Nitrospira sp.]
MKQILTVGLLAAFTLVSVGSVEADMFVYPKKGQSKDQQQKDQYECHLWAVEQTGVDPMKPAQPPPATAQSGGGEVVHGAAKGAALGAIGGAIAGDAGKGAAVGAAVGGGAGAMKRRGHQKQQQQAQQQAAQKQQTDVQAYQRALGVCMEGRGYQVG